MPNAAGLDAGGLSYLLKPTAWPLLMPHICSVSGLARASAKTCVPMGVTAAKGVASDAQGRDCTHARQVIHEVLAEPVRPAHS